MVYGKITHTSFQLAHITFFTFIPYFILFSLVVTLQEQTTPQREHEQIKKWPSDRLIVLSSCLKM